MGGRRGLICGIWPGGVSVCLQCAGFCQRDGAGRGGGKGEFDIGEGDLVGYGGYSARTGVSFW